MDADVVSSILDSLAGDGDVPPAYHFMLDSIRRAALDGELDSEIVSVIFKWFAANTLDALDSYDLNKLNRVARVYSSLMDLVFPTVH